jgi:hypothetical protein
MSGTSTVIAFVPGTTASELNDQIGNVWPNLLNSDLNKVRRDAIALEMKNTTSLKVWNVVSAYPTSNTDSKPCYASLIQYITTATNFGNCSPGWLSAWDSPVRFGHWGW